MRNKSSYLSDVVFKEVPNKTRTIFLKKKHFHTFLRELQQLWHNSYHGVNMTY
jgi:hypothetical protein